MLKLTTHVWKKICRKTARKGLIQHYDGPFKIVKGIGRLAYRLDLPAHLKLHPIFCASFLKKYAEDPNDPSRVQGLGLLQQSETNILTWPKPSLTTKPKGKVRKIGGPTTW